ncbi:MAG: endopeptidase La [Bacteroidales bacterium]|nr:endopeptidase La [Bacteroidales bacterium]
MFEHEFINLSEIITGNAEFVPLLTMDDEKKMNKEKVPETLPILPLRNTVLFPGVLIPITVGREKSAELIKNVNRNNKILGVISQKNPDIEDPCFDDLNSIGTIAKIIKVLQMPDGNTAVIIQGKQRFHLDKFVQSDPFIIAKVSQCENIKPPVQSKNFKALISMLRDVSMQIVKKSPNIPSDASFALQNIESPLFIINYISSNLNVDVNEKQKLLEISDIEERGKLALKHLNKELQMIELKNQIQNKVKVELDKQQRDFLLNQQLKKIQEELGDNPSGHEINELKEKAKNKKWSKEVAEIFDNELKKLQRMNSASPEYSIQINYLDILVNLPWNEFTEDNFDLKNAQKILDNDHYGLEKVKERIIEYLAVLKLKGDMKSPILCLVGPPGVGKTSLGKSVAHAVNRKYIRMSLGGLRDEAEIRGHRKTYIGAMPGRIIQSLKKIKTSNPVFVLDEIDKVSGNNINGDPEAALLEVLDPEQNSSFYDNFLEIEYDLSRIMFIATANSLSTIHPALRDRMEIINISGYLAEEKVEIAKRHLIPKELKAHGVKKSQLSFPDKIIAQIINDYTRESGVRSLEKNIARVIRNRAKFIVMGDKYNKKITKDDIVDILGAPIFNRDESISNEVAGVVTGLAWTVVGGEILFIEVSLSKGKGELTLTGNLGDVMKESARIAFEYLKAHSHLLNIDAKVFNKWNVHIHVPEGATPKDGPSAGITMFTALASAFTQRKVKAKIAMTGETTLRGKVLPVGGIKEKILAAKRAKITDICLSSGNKKDIEEIKPEYIKGLKFHYIDEMIEIIDLALLKQKVKNPIDLMADIKD